ncbi:MAG: invasion protein regulator, partial [Lacunisphaera sp.]|nr:invasion protein regulator [Lacunisphaera sp.]
MPDSTRAIFLSYARDDAAAARRLAEALRASGLEVWFDENELRGGDSWDAKIRQQIDACALFVAVISRHTQDRSKGYFRLEWKLAVDQTHLLAAGVPFIAPVVIDDTPEGGALVPPEFMRVQWMRLPGALPSPQFVEQVKRLLEGKATEAGRPRAAQRDDGVVSQKKPSPAVSGWRWGVAAFVLGAIAVGVILLRKPGTPVVPPPPAASAQPVAAVPAAAPAAPDKSIAVLPFANLSTDKENEFFADGVHDDVITNLAKIRDLKVISRTSVLAYRDPAARNLKKIAGELGVATILEGSIRRVGSKVHMNAQLIDARTDEHLWADTFDGDTADIFALQASLAQKIAAALQATLTPRERTLIARRPTDDQEAYELYLRGRVLHAALSATGTREQYDAVSALYERARARDPAFALVHVQLTLIYGTMYWFGQIDPTPERRALAERELAAAEQLAPDSPETHYARGAFAYLCENNWERALQEYRLAEASLPNDARLKYLIGIAHRRLGHWPEALDGFDQAANLNPNDLSVLTTQIETVTFLRHYARLHELVIRYLTLFPDSEILQGSLVQANFALDGNTVAYRQAMADLPPLASDPLGLQKRYALALLAADQGEAGRALADPRLKFIPASSGAINEPVALHQAQVALWRGDRIAAKKFAEEAIAAYQAGQWTPRQQPLVRLAIARARTMAGQLDAGIRDIQAARHALAEQDKFLAFTCLPEVAATLALVGRREEALDCLREYLTGPSDLSPHELRLDPFFAGLR